MNKVGLIALGALSLLASAAVGCGEDGKSVSESDCPAQPLYRYEYDLSTDTWKRVQPNSTPDGADDKPLTPADEKKIHAAEPDCLTPAGSALTLGSGGSGSGGQQGTADAGP